MIEFICFTVVYHKRAFARVMLACQLAACQLRQQLPTKLLLKKYRVDKPWSKSFQKFSVLNSEFDSVVYVC